ncbi:L,D-transpeptidase family protein [Desulfotomaculum copahuensis]|uniref:Uncharacterized protein n=1 Tax=Desulfotomaculum copahuensis TaxID=1838280 RepID=A0A1B7LFK4_9FIRM|nr:L,D-transpeptidase family protein [Desulfotomaculum copahuensis]OAT82946.1 hypothetical protein A6M21_08285 [Desulfotomaculum copahuensis]
MSDEPRLLEAGTHLVVDTAWRRLQHYQGDSLAATYPVAVGKPSTPTPLGHYQVIYKMLNPGGVLGTRWLGLNIPNGNYGIHGTNSPALIGQAVSNGCIRMHNHHVEELFPRVDPGTPVLIVAGGTVQVNTEGSGSYTVVAGDTLWLIARRFNVPLSALVNANHLADPDNLQPGQVLIIPR